MFSCVYDREQVTPLECHTALMRPTLACTILHRRYIVGSNTNPINGPRLTTSRRCKLTRTEFHYNCDEPLYQEAINFADKQQHQCFEVSSSLISHGAVASVLWCLVISHLARCSSISALRSRISHLVYSTR